MKKLLLAMQFLTIIPVKIKGTVSEDEIAKSAIFFPLIGAFEGVLISLAAFLFIRIFPSGITAAIIILFYIMINGGFHFDGLADTFDAISIKSTGNDLIDKEKRLTVMKDSTIGTMGVIAVAMSILLKYVFIGALFQKCDLPHIYYILFLMPLCSKWIMIPAMYHGKAARKEGLGSMFIINTRAHILLLSTMLLAIIYFLASLLFAGINVLNSIILLSFISFVLYIFSLLWAVFCNRKFGGLTGDNLGAISEIAEIIFLALVFLWI
ncbi:MAG: adenosylcobinamide-GDP ribazoletransferase [Proteobacteria bacterium]|nr:adenosylcobinamide-GDP ribazoletransferase [Pseudomonadota bacterium]